MIATKPTAINKELFIKVFRENKGMCLCKSDTHCPCEEFINDNFCECEVFIEVEKKC